MILASLNKTKFKKTKSTLSTTQLKILINFKHASNPKFEVFAMKYTSTSDSINKLLVHYLNITISVVTYRFR